MAAEPKARRLSIHEGYTGNIGRAMKVATLLPATEPCHGTTQKGKRCAAKDVYENGRCKLHGGQGKSLTEKRLELRLDIARMRAAGRSKKAPGYAALVRILEAQIAQQEKERNALRTD